MPAVVVACEVALNAAVALWGVWLTSVSVLLGAASTAS